MNARQNMASGGKRRTCPDQELSKKGLREEVSVERGVEHSGGRLGTLHRAARSRGEIPQQGLQPGRSTPRGTIWQGRQSEACVMLVATPVCRRVLLPPATPMPVGLKLLVMLAPWDYRAIVFPI